MRAVVQRVSRSEVVANGNLNGRIDKGILVLLAVGHEDNEADMEYLADKIISLRIFDDKDGKMNLSLLDTGGQVMVISQFTLFGDCRKGRRPSYSEAAGPETASRLYNKFVEYIRGKYPVHVETGIFQADMKVSLTNDGPVTLLLDSKKMF